MPTDERELRVARRRQAWSALSPADRIAIGLLVAAPILLYVPFSLVGHPLVPGDDFAQNYPLRVLAGSLIRSGHLPTWDPYVWSGTPLLAGWNAGALYPGTWLFAVLPGVAAWTVNLVSVGAIAGTGTYALLRLHRCGPLGAMLGGLSFTYAGFMSGQLSHIGLVEGTGYVPWMLVAIELLVRFPRARSAVGPMLLLTLGLSLCVLAGEPRAVSSAGVIVVVYLAACVVRLQWQHKLRVLARAACGIALGAGIAAIQWLPGLSFVSSSQRALNAYQAFGVGSLSWTTMVQELLVPFLIGGNGNFGLPHYQGGYNIPELTIGMGLLPLVALCAYLPGVCAEGLRTLREVARHRSRRSPHGVSRSGSPRRALGVWYVMIIVGVVLSLGTTTPFGRVLAALPLYGGERLQNRNAVIFDFALAVLLGLYVDDRFVPDQHRREQSPRSRPPPGTLPRRLLSIAPVAACLALVALAYLHPLGLQYHLGVARRSEDLFKRLTPYLAATVVLAVAVGLTVLFAHRIPHRARLVLVSALVCADTGVFVASALYSTAPSSVLAGPTSASTTLAGLTGNGRFALYNPLVRDASDGAEVGEPDLNILRGLQSAQGYGSILGGVYEVETDTHDLESLDPDVLHNGLADTLDLRVVLTQPNYLEEPLPPKSAIPVAGAPPVSPTGQHVPTSDAKSPPLLASGPWSVIADGERTWFLPSVMSVDELTIVVNNGYDGRPARLEVALGRQSRPTRFTTVPVVNGLVHLRLAEASRADAVVVRNAPGWGRATTIGAVVAGTRSPEQRLLLDGSLQGALTTPQWSFGGTLGAFTVFVNHDANGLAWLQPASSHSSQSAPRASGSVETNLDVASDTDEMLVTAPQPELLVRSVAYEQGWTAALEPLDGGAARSVAVRRLGLVQAIRVPAGRYWVSWHYSPPSLVAGCALTLGSIATFVVLTVLDVVVRRRKKLAASELEGLRHM